MLCTLSPACFLLQLWIIAEFFFEHLKTGTCESQKRYLWYVQFYKVQGENVVKPHDNTKIQWGILTQSHTDITMIDYECVLFVVQVDCDLSMSTILLLILLVVSVIGFDKGPTRDAALAALAGKIRGDLWRPWKVWQIVTSSICISVTRFKTWDFWGNENLEIHYFLMYTGPVSILQERSQLHYFHFLLLLKAQRDGTMFQHQTRETVGFEG